MPTLLTHLFINVGTLDSLSSIHNVVRWETNSCSAQGQRASTSGSEVHCLPEAAVDQKQVSSSNKALGRRPRATTGQWIISYLALLWLWLCPGTWSPFSLILTIVDVVCLPSLMCQQYTFIYIVYIRLTGNIELPPYGRAGQWKEQWQLTSRYYIFWALPCPDC